MKKEKQVLSDLQKQRLARAEALRQARQRRIQAYNRREAPGDEKVVMSKQPKGNENWGTSRNLFWPATLLRDQQVQRVLQVPVKRGRGMGKRSTKKEIKEVIEMESDKDDEEESKNEYPELKKVEIRQNPTLREIFRAKQEKKSPPPRRERTPSPPRPPTPPPAEERYEIVFDTAHSFLYSNCAKIGVFTDPEAGINVQLLGDRVFEIQDGNEMRSYNESRNFIRAPEEIEVTEENLQLHIKSVSNLIPDFREHISEMEDMNEIEQLIKEVRQNFFDLKSYQIPVFFSPVITWFPGRIAGEVEEMIVDQSSFRDVENLISEEFKNPNLLEELIPIQVDRNRVTVDYPGLDIRIAIDLNNIDLMHRVPAVNEEEMQRTFMNILLNTFHTQIDEFNLNERETASRAIGVTACEVVERNPELVKKMCQFIFNLRMRDQNDLNRFRNGFDSASAGNKRGVERIGGAPLPPLPQPEGGFFDEDEKEQKERAVMTDSKIRLPFSFQTEDPRLDDKLKLITVRFVHRLMQTTQFPEAGRLGVMSPAMILFLWLTFTTISDSLFKQIAMKTRYEGNYYASIFSSLVQPFLPSRTMTIVHNRTPENQMRISTFEYVEEQDGPTNVFYTTQVRGFLHFTQKFIGLFMDYSKKYIEPRVREVSQITEEPFDEIVQVRIVPANIINFNEHFTRLTPSTTLRLSLPRNVKFGARFRNMLAQENQQIKKSQYTDAIDSDMLFTRAVDFQAVELGSDLSAFMAVESIKLEIQKALHQIYIALSDYPWEELEKQIDSWRIFLGMEIICLEQENAYEQTIYPDMSPFIQTKDQRVVRMASLNLELKNLRPVKNGQEYRYGFNGVQITKRRRRGMLQQDYERVLNAYELERPRERRDLRTVGVMEAVIEFINSDDFDIQDMADFTDASASADLDEARIFTEKYINQITIFSMPIYQTHAGVLPLISRLKFAPISINNQNIALLNQTPGYAGITELTENEEELAQVFEMSCVQYTLFHLTKLVWQFYLGYTLPEPFLRQIFELTLEFDGNLATMLALYHRKVTEYCDNKERPTPIFLIDGCHLTFYNFSQTINKHYDFDLLSQDNPEYPVLCVKSLTEEHEAGHCFVSTMKSVRNYIKIFGSYQMRAAQKEKYNGHPGFTLTPRPPNMFERGDAPWKEDIVDSHSKLIWALDIETYSAKMTTMEPYCIVISNYQGVVFSVMNEPEYVLLEFQQFMVDLRTKRLPDHKQPLHIYAHNGSRFDWVILLRTLLRVFTDITIFGSATNVKAIVIPSINVKLLDFVLMVPMPLAKIGQSFNVEHKKTQCEVIKDLASYKDLSEDQKEKIMEYCINDTACLYDCVKAFMQEVAGILKPKNDIALNILLPPTNSTLAQEVFRSKFQECGEFRGTLDHFIDECETDAYYGGMTQAFTFREVHDVWYVDANSLYPYAMTEIKVSTKPAQKEDVQPFVFNFPQNQQQFTGAVDNIYLVNQFVFKAYSPGLLPVRCQDGTLCWPRTSDKPGWRTGHEIKELVMSGLLQEISVSKVIDYRAGESKPFQQYVQSIYAQKQQAVRDKDDVQQIIFKLLLNQLYGKFAQRQFSESRILPLMSIMNDPALPTRIARQNFNAAVMCDLMNPMTEERPFLQELFKGENQSRHVDKRAQFVPQLMAINQVDPDNQFVELVFEKSQADVQRIGMLKRISLLTTGKARAHIIRQFTFLHKHLGADLMQHVHYMDTDSLFLSQKAYDILKDRNMIHPDELGQFKKEIPQLLRDFRSFGNQMYYCKPHGGGKLQCKFKGLQKSYIDKQPDEETQINLFRSMLNPKQIIQVENTRWTRKFGQVVIEDITKMTISRPRRLVRHDGRSQCFQTVEDFQKFTESNRLVEPERGIFEYIPFIQPQKKK